MRVNIFHKKISFSIQPLSQFSRMMLASLPAELLEVCRFDEMCSVQIPYQIIYILFDQFTFQKITVDQSINPPLMC